MEERDAVAYVIESKKTLALGDRVQVEGKELVVAKSMACMKQGVLIYTYHLLSEAGIRQNRQSIPSLPGTAIEGKVLEVKKDQVRLHLSIDDTQKKEEAAWFSLATPYTAEGHSGFYSPPEEGDSVHLAFSTHREEAAVVRHSVRQDGDTNPKTADPQTSYWGTPKGKEMKLDPQSVTFTAQEGAVFLQLHQESGIEVHSKHPLKVRANENITFAGKSIAMSATESIHITCGTSSLVLDGKTDMQGQVVTMEGSIKAPVSVSTSEDGADLESALDVMGMIPVDGGGVSGYYNAPLARRLFERKFFVYMSYRRFATKDHPNCRRYQFKQVNEDLYACPCGVPFYYKTTNRQGYNEFKPPKGSCQSCPFVKRENEDRVLRISIHPEIYNQLRGQRLSYRGKILRSVRPATVELSFAHSKELHGLRYARYRGDQKVKRQVLMTAIIQNLKKWTKLRSLKQIGLHLTHEIIEESV